MMSGHQQRPQQPSRLPQGRQAYSTNGLHNPPTRPAAPYYSTQQAPSAPYSSYQPAPGPRPAAPAGRAYPTNITSHNNPFAHGNQQPRPPNIRPFNAPPVGGNQQPYPQARPPAPLQPRPVNNSLQRYAPNATGQSFQYADGRPQTFFRGQAQSTLSDGSRQTTHLTNQGQSLHPNRPVNSRPPQSRVHNTPGPIPGRQNPIDDVYVAVMGITGSGKSTFVKLCSQQDARIGHGGLSSELIQTSPLIWAR
jgi:hypothetical protein